jgi:hypothetical protein
MNEDDSSVMFPFLASSKEKSHLIRFPQGITCFDTDRRCFHKALIAENVTICFADD